MMNRTLLILVLMLFSSSVLAQTNGGDAPGAEEPVPEEVVADLTGDAVRDVIARIPELSAVQVEQGAGVVTLTGSVARTEMRSAAETLASKIDGVLWVDNRIRVTDGTEEGEAEDDPNAADAAIRERIESVFSNVPDLQNVTVSVRSGVVRLQGSVLSESALTKAEELARSTDGVVYVDNDLEEARDVQERISPALKKAREVLSDFIATLPLFAVAIVILFVFSVIARLVSQSGWLFRRLDDKPLIQGIVRQLVWVVILGAGVVLILELFSLTALVSAVLGTAGVAGLAIGFAFKDIVENYLASLMLSVRQPFAKNDIVKIDDQMGKVVRLSTRDTVLMTLDGNHLRLPNAMVFKAIILNYSRNPLRRFDFVVGVGVGEDLAETMTLGLETVKETKGILDDPKAFVVVEALGDFTVDLHFYAWVNQSETDFMAAKSSAIRRVKEVFDDAAIDMPEPTQRILHTTWEPPQPKPRRTTPVHDDIEAPVTEQIDDQIERDRLVSDEPDLLRPDAK